MNISMQRKIGILPLLVHFSLLRQNIWNWLLKKMRFIKLTVLEVKHWKLHLFLALAFGEGLTTYGMIAEVVWESGITLGDRKPKKRERGHSWFFWKFSHEYFPGSQRSYTNCFWGIHSKKHNQSHPMISLEDRSLRSQQVWHCHT